MSIRVCRSSPRPQRSNDRPRGIAVVLVLGLLAMTLAISYATLRSQGTTAEAARNKSRLGDARAAAQSGLNAALQKMSNSNWSGVNSTLRSNLTDNSWYQVTFTTGDRKLTTTDALYGEYPFRVTIESTGVASDPLNPAIQTQHVSRCIVQLMRKDILDEPAGWSNLTSFNVYHYSNHDCYVQFPVRINGPTCLLGKLSFCNEYPNNPPSRDLYLSGLNARRLAGLGDYRPFPTTLTIKGIATTQDSSTMSVLTGQLGTVLTEPLASSIPPSHPGKITAYTLYPGGQSYNVPRLQDYGNPIQNVTLAPDPATNPLGIFRTDGSLTIGNNVQITGTIISDNSGGSEITITGTDVILKPFSLPALYGSPQTYQLPAVLSKAALRLNSGSEAELSGATIVWDQFEVKPGSSSTSFLLTGNLIADTVLVRGRTNWVMTPSVWNGDRSLFSLQLVTAHPIPYFPDFEQILRGMVVKPALTFSPDSSGVKPHWHDWSKAVYQPDSADPGLRWEIVRWEEAL
jgi:hypothetical protein